MNDYFSKLIGVFVVFIGYFIFHFTNEHETKYKNVFFMISFITSLFGVFLIFYFTLK